MVSGVSRAALAVWFGTPIAVLAIMLAWIVSTLTHG